MLNPNIQTEIPLDAAGKDQQWQDDLEELGIKLLPDTNKTLKEIITKCIFVVDIATPASSTFYNEAADRIYPYTETAIRRLLGKKNKSYFAKRTKYGQFTYNPHQTTISTNEQGIMVFNTYQKPNWMRTKCHPKIPAIHHEFFLHLVGHDIPSYNYLLDWLATSLQSRNQTILVCIAGEGTGKGTLGNIIQALHGETNFSKVRDTIFRTKFNGAIQNKSLIYVDEASIKDKDALDRIKDVVNGYIEVERKGKDAINIDNHASFYLSSNSYDAIRFGADDRRFSIIEMTETPLRDTDIIQHMDELTDESNIQQLGWFLLQRKPDSNMLVPFKGQHAEEVKEAGLADWEFWLVNDWHEQQQKDDEIDWRDIKRDISAFQNISVGRKELESAVKKYPDKLKWKQIRKSSIRKVIVL